MPKYLVHMINPVSTMVEVEADNPEAALDAAYDSPDMPGGMSHSAFGNATVDEGEWTAVCVEDSSGNEVWTEESQ